MGDKFTSQFSNFKMTLCLIHHYITRSQSFKSSLLFPGSTWHLILSPQGATDNTKQALMETVNSSSSVLLQKLDLTQQDLLKQSKARNPVVTATKKRPLVNLKPEKIGVNSTDLRILWCLIDNWAVMRSGIWSSTIGSSSAILKPLIRFLSSWTNPNILHRNRMPCWKALPPNKMVFQSRWTPDMSSRANAWWRWKARQHSWWKLWFFQFQAALSTHTHTPLSRPNEWWALTLTLEVSIDCVGVLIWSLSSGLKHIWCIRIFMVLDCDKYDICFHIPTSL